MKTTIFYNPRCSKCRDALCRINDSGNEAEIVEYLTDTPTEAELASLIEKLGISPEALVRRNEPVFEEKFKGKKLSPKQWIKAMVKNPTLIQRPILIRGGKAVIGRDPDTLDAFLAE